MKKTRQLANGAAVDIYLPESIEPKKAIIYFHGGGLIYGTKGDLTEELKQVFLKNGFQVIAVDYLLAPNTSLPNILTALEETIGLLKDEVIQSRPFGFCGRSAGSFLMLQLVKRGLLPRPDFLVNFYGYTDLSFIDTPRHLIEQTISEKEIQQVEQKENVWDDPFLNRYLLYHYAVQQQMISKFYGISEETIHEFAITKETLQTFPPCFSSASSSDEEIPFRYSKLLGKTIPNSRFEPVYYLEHDFLKLSQDSQVQKVLKHLDNWLTSVL